MGHRLLVHHPRGVFTVDDANEGAFKPLEARNCTNVTNAGGSFPRNVAKPETGILLKNSPPETRRTAVDDRRECGRNEFRGCYEKPPRRRKRRG
ncbi:hypothetical protein KM043_016593 [Ampulex compressa]|nr:hypothetical protein KM043_016593 [Ampulex compressa]